MQLRFHLTVGNMVDLRLAASEAEARAEGLRLVQAMDPAAKVGAVHHTVPRFYLRRFARADRILTRVPGEDGIRLRNVGDMGQRDFYTVVVDKDLLEHIANAATFPDQLTTAAVTPSEGQTELDARLEDVLSTVEGWAATVFHRLTDYPQDSVDREERYTLATFLAFQMVRGVRHRRELELIAEFYAKTMLRQPLPPKVRRRVEITQARRNGRTPSRGDGLRLPPKSSQRDAITDAQLTKVGIRPHPNEHLRQFGGVTEEIAPHLFVRPYTFVELDEPLLVTGDEPVVVVGEAGAEHLPSCYLTPKQRKRRLVAAMAEGREHREILHLYTTRPLAVAVAEEVAIPLDPSRALVLGPKNTARPPLVRLEGAAARDFADDLNTRIANQAYMWVAAHPDNPSFETMTIPATGPLVMACDGASQGELTLNRPPEPRSTERLRLRKWRT